MTEIFLNALTPEQFSKIESRHLLGIGETKDVTSISVKPALTCLLIQESFNSVDKFVFSSTCATYGEPTRTPISETHVQQPINPYGRTKLMIEQALHDYATAYGLQSISLRYFNAAGCDPKLRAGERHDPETHLIPLVLAEALRLKCGGDPVETKLEMFGSDLPTPDGTCVRDYIHVSDLAQAHVAVLDHIGNGDGNVTMNCGYGHGYSVREVLDVVDQVAADMLAAAPMTRRPAPRRAGDPASLVADSSRIRKTLNWQPKYDDLNVMAATALAWEKTLLDGMN